MANSITKTVILSSGDDTLGQIKPFVDELKSWTGFNNELYENILLVLSEAVTNAMVHGNESDPKKKVKVTARKSKEELLEIEINDEGEGFDPSELPDPRKEENLLKPGGRGIYIIKHYTEHAEYSEGGTRLTLYFPLDDKKNG